MIKLYYTKNNGRDVICGGLDDDYKVKKTIKTKHMLTSFEGGALALDEAMILNAHSLGATHVEVYNKETKTLYQISMDAFIEKGIPWNKGFGKQLALPLSYWTQVSK